MRRQSPFAALRWLSLIFILLAVVLFISQLVRFSRMWAYYPPGLTISGIPIGQLDRQQAAQRLQEAFAVPVELHYGDSVIQLSPSVVSFELDLDGMLSAAEQERTRIPFWEAYWNFLWGRTESRLDIPLRMNYSKERLRAYLSNEIAARYDHPPLPAKPVPGTVNFLPGEPGVSLDVERSILLIDSALRSTNQRVVDLPISRTSPTRPAYQNLQVLLRQTLEVAGFDGLAGVYQLDLQNGQEIHFLYYNGRLISANPDMAFTASSTIKVPIMIATLRRAGDPPSADVVANLQEMISFSRNPPADWLMENVLGKERGPLAVAEDMQALGLKNTFLAGYFAPGSPLLQVFKTPANTREDLLTDPDVYSQTTPSDIGMLLEDLYQCSQTGGGSLVAVFPGEINQAKCQAMIEYLKSDHLPNLITAGLPEATPIAHKHGWVTDINGVMHDVSDAAIVYTPGGNYVLVIFLYNPNQIIWDTASRMVADLSRAVYNFYNVPLK